jgi:hypothetical protein
MTIREIFGWSIIKLLGLAVGAGAAIVGLAVLLARCT